MGVRKTSYSCLLLLALVLAVQIQLNSAVGFDECGSMERSEFVKLLRDLGSFNSLKGKYSTCQSQCGLDVKRAIESRGRDIILSPPFVSNCYEKYCERGGDLECEDKFCYETCSEDCANMLKDAFCRENFQNLSGAASIAPEKDPFGASFYSTAVEEAAEEAAKASSDSTAPSVSGSLQLTYGLFSICVALFMALF